MSTSVKAGWARRDYGRDRFDIQLDMADLPQILADYGVSADGHERMPFATRLRVLRLEAEIIAKTVYYDHEVADARASAAVGQAPTPTAAMRALKPEVEAMRARRDEMLAPYKPAKTPEPATA